MPVGPDVPEPDLAAEDEAAPREDLDACDSCGRQFEPEDLVLQPFGYLCRECIERKERENEDLYSTLTPMSEVHAKPIRWVWRDRIAMGKVTALAGKPKGGKGLLWSWLFAQITRGRLPGDLRGMRPVIFVTTEDDPSDTIKPRLMAAGALQHLVHQFKVGSAKDPHPFRIPHDVAELEKRVRQVRPALVVIDPLMEFLDGNVDSHKSHGVRQALSSLRPIVEDTDCGILAVYHLNKSRSTDPLMRHEGSAAFTQVIRGALMLGPDPKAPKGSRRILAASSSNLAELPSSLVYEIATKQVMGHRDMIEAPYMIAVGECETTAEELLTESKAAGREGEQTALCEARDFLRRELADGPQLATKVTAASRIHGIAPRTLKRAREEMKIRAEKDGFQGPWKWSLPALKPVEPNDQKPVEQRRPNLDGRLWNEDDGLLWESPVDTGDSEDRPSKEDHHHGVDSFGGNGHLSTPQEEELVARLVEEFDAEDKDR
jgi:putative DNA primase/helicase